MIHTSPNALKFKGQTLPEKDLEENTNCTRVNSEKFQLNFLEKKRNIES